MGIIFKILCQKKLYFPLRKCSPPLLMDSKHHEVDHISFFTLTTRHLRTTYLIRLQDLWTTCLGSTLSPLPLGLTLFEFLFPIIFYLSYMLSEYCQIHPIKKYQDVNKVVNLLLREIALPNESLAALNICTVLFGKIASVILKCV